MEHGRGMRWNKADNVIEHGRGTQRKMVEERGGTWQRNTVEHC